MENQAALYKLMYRNEMLFRLPGTVVPPAAPVQQPQTPPVPEVRVKDVALPVPVKPAVQFPELRHKLLVVIDEPARPELLPEEAAFLDNVLKAIGHSRESIDLLNLKFLPGRDARAVLSGKKTNYFITFGVPLIKLQIDLLMAPYTPKLAEGIWFLLADPLAVIEADKNLKKKLWQGLQQMFKAS